MQSQYEYMFYSSIHRSVRAISVVFECFAHMNVCKHLQIFKHLQGDRESKCKSENITNFILAMCKRIMQHIVIDYRLAK